MCVYAWLTCIVRCAVATRLPPFPCCRSPAQRGMPAQYAPAPGINQVPAHMLRHMHTLTNTCSHARTHTRTHTHTAPPPPPCTHTCAYSRGLTPEWQAAVVHVAWQQRGCADPQPPHTLLLTHTHHGLDRVEQGLHGGGSVGYCVWGAMNKCANVVGWGHTVGVGWGGVGMCGGR